VVTPAVLALAILAASPFGARLVDLEARVEGQQVLVSFDLDGAFDRDLTERLESGLATPLLYELRLVRERRRWLDKEVAASQLEVVALYNAVTREYAVHYRLDGRLVESRTARSLSELEGAMTRVRRFAVFSLRGLAGGTRLLVRARADLGARTVLGLFPSRVTTDWADSAPLIVPTLPLRSEP